MTSFTSTKHQTPGRAETPFAEFMATMHGPGRAIGMSAWSFADHIGQHFSDDPQAQRYAATLRARVKPWPAEAVKAFASANARRGMEPQPATTSAAAASVDDSQFCSGIAEMLELTKPERWQGANRTTWNACIHEAGHAVTTFYLGGRVHWAVAHQGGGGRVCYKNTDLNARDDCIMSAAGAAAEAWFNLGTGEMQNASAGCDQWSFDGALVDSTGDPWAVTGREADALNAQAFDIVKVNRSRIAATADLLWNNLGKQISGDALRVVFDGVPVDVD